MTESISRWVWAERCRSNVALVDPGITVHKVTPLVNAHKSVKYCQSHSMGHDNLSQGCTELTTKDEWSRVVFAFRRGQHESNERHLFLIRLAMRNYFVFPSVDMNHKFANSIETRVRNSTGRVNFPGIGIGISQVLVLGKVYLPPLPPFPGHPAPKIASLILRQKLA